MSSPTADMDTTFKDTRTEVTISTHDATQSHDVPDISVVVCKRPRYSVELGGTTHYCQNVNGVVRLMKEFDRVISTNDVFKSIDMPPRCRYRLKERLNGAVIKKVPGI
jgi:hypothetical protein